MVRVEEVGSHKKCPQFFRRAYLDTNPLLFGNPWYTWSWKFEHECLLNYIFVFISSYSKPDAKSWNQSLADNHWRVEGVLSVFHIALKVAVIAQKAADSCRGSLQTALTLRADISEPCRHRLEPRIASSCLYEKRFLQSMAAWRGSRLQKAALHDRDLYLQQLQGSCRWEG